MMARARRERLRKLLGVRVPPRKREVDSVKREKNRLRIARWRQRRRELKAPKVVPHI